MKFYAIIVIVLIIFNKIEAQFNELRYSTVPNCTEVYSTVAVNYVPYTEVYTVRNFFGFPKTKTRTNYKLENRTIFHEKSVCCHGYTNYDSMCLPVCNKSCGKNEVCSSPETCKCIDGFEIDNNLNECRPICENKCINGNCILPNVCVCMVGFYLQGNICEPICNSCADLEYCVEPQVCQCINGYTRIPIQRQVNDFQYEYIDNYKCKPICDRECINANCVEPNLCKCHDGYEHFDNDIFTCTPKCIHGCKNGRCTSPNFCTCFTGYKLKTNSYNICEPICTSECINSECIAPDICSCYDGYIPLGKKMTHICQPYCSNPCSYGRCSSPETCSCEIGYKLNIDKNLCEPICSESCFMGNCTSPDICTCFENYRHKEDNKFICEPICSNECINGQCIAPEECVCDYGYEKNNLTNDNSKCVVICECENGYCDETNSSCITCLEGYDLIYSSNLTICKPYCKSDCINGQCIGPQICYCNEYYVSNNDSQGNPVCIHACGMECVHGICLEKSGICDCSYGWSGSYCDEPLLCSITIFKNESIFFQLNKSTDYNELETKIIIEESWPICNDQCSKKINNTTMCINQLNEEFYNITCLIDMDLECNSYKYIQYNTCKAKVNIMIVVIYSIITLMVLIMAIYGCPLFVRKSMKLYVELMESTKVLQKNEDNTLIQINNFSTRL